MKGLRRLASVVWLALLCLSLVPSVFAASCPMPCCQPAVKEAAKHSCCAPKAALTAKATCGCTFAAQTQNVPVDPRTLLKAAEEPIATLEPVEAAVTDELRPVSAPVPHPARWLPHPPDSTLWARGPPRSVNL